MRTFLSPPSALVLLAVIACHEAIPPVRQNLEPASPAEPETWGPGQKAEPPAPAPPAAEPEKPKVPPPTCASYCAAVTDNCTGLNAAFPSADTCLTACRSAPWSAGKPGDIAGASLACHVTWAQKAASDPNACREASPSGSACGGPSADAPTEPPLLPASLPPYDGGDCVLGLYDSMDGLSWHAGDRSRKVILGERVKAVLDAKGLKLRLVNVNEAIPVDIGSCRAVVTSFYDGTMPNAKAYAAWLAGVLASGRRVLILGDYGAYQDAETHAFMDHAVVNLPLAMLGATYEADWTKDPKKLRVTSRDKAFFAKEPSLKRAQHYYRFKPAKDDVQVLLEVNRTDLVAGKSVVAYTTPRGGMALTRYYEDRDGHEVVNLPALMAAALGL